MKFQLNYSILFSLIFLGFYGQSCKHQSIPPEENNSPCDTTNVTYSKTILPIIEKNCQNCHSVYSSGGGIDLSSYEGVKAIALSGQLYGSVSFASGFSAMPKGGTKLSDCQLQNIDKWIKAGAPQN